MFQLWRFAHRAARNPKILIPVSAFIVIAFVLDRTVFGSPANPLPHPADVKTVFCARGPGAAEALFRPLGMDKYTALRRHLEGAKRLVYSGTGELAAKLRVHLRDGDTFRAELYEWGLVRTADGLFEGATDRQTNQAAAIIQDIGGQY